MKEFRSPHPDDQEKAEYAFQLIKNIYSNHPEVEPTLWASALWSSLVQGYKNCEFTYEEFYLEVLQVLEFYRNQYEDLGNHDG